MAVNDGVAKWVKFNELGEYLAKHPQTTFRLQPTHMKTFQKQLNSSIQNPEFGAVLKIQREKPDEQWIRTGYLGDGFSYSDYHVHGIIVTPLFTARTGPGFALLAVPYGAAAVILMAYVSKLIKRKRGLA